MHALTLFQEPFVCRYVRFESLPDMCSLCLLTDKRNSHFRKCSRCAGVSTLRADDYSLSNKGQLTHTYKAAEYEDFMYEDLHSKNT